MSGKKTFYNLLAKPNKTPIDLEIEKAKGSYIYTKNQKILDFVSGVSACPLGHNNKKINQAVFKQIKKHSHVMVYGEFIQKKQVELAEKILKNFPKKLNNIYLVNSGTEAIEAAIKLAKKATNRYEIISCKKSYHGSTNGSLSIWGGEKNKNPFRPLIPGCKTIKFNNINSITKITDKTAAIIVEPIQSSTGFTTPKKNYLKLLRKRCNETKTLLIFDEIQSCYGRTGEMFGFQKYKVTPDVLCVAKGFGCGYPLGGLISSRILMNKLNFKPELGHITTFGGNPVSCAASIAGYKEIKKKSFLKDIIKKGELIKQKLKHELIRQVKGEGLMIGLELYDEKTAKTIIKSCLKNNLLLFYFLSNSKCIRITPPLNITKFELEQGCEIILNELNKLTKK